MYPAAPCRFDSVSPSRRSSARLPPVPLRPATAEFGCRIPPPRRRFDRREPDPDPRTPSARPPSRRSPGGHRGASLHSAPTARPRGLAGGPPSSEPGACDPPARLDRLRPRHPSRWPNPLCLFRDHAKAAARVVGRRGAIPCLSAQSPPSGPAPALAGRNSEISFHPGGPPSAHRIPTRRSTRRPHPDPTPLPLPIQRRSP